jgi:prealbumin domain-containing protein
MMRGMRIRHGLRLTRGFWSGGPPVLLLLLAALLFATPAEAANCYSATSQGSTGPSDYASYCWIDLSIYNDAAARSASGQAYSLTLQDGSTMSFTMKVSGSAASPAAAPSWSGAAIGNTAFLGIAGKPIFYQSASGTTTVTFSNIKITPPAGVQSVTQYMLVAADGESSNDGEQLTFQTNGGSWSVLDQAGPISGSTYPTTSGTSTQTFVETGVAGTVGSYIVGSSTPTAVTSTLLGSGLQGAMFAVRFATIQLNTLIGGARVSSADQFTFEIDSASGGASLSSGTSSGTGLGPFTAASLSSTSAIPLTLNQAMAGGSTNAISHYQSKLTCINSTAGSSTALPSNVTTASYAFGALRYGDNVSCTFTETPYPHLTLTKRMGTGGRRFTDDQFTLEVNQGSTTVATTTTTGTFSTVNNASTPQYQATAGTTYTLDEEGAGGTSLVQYTSTMACSNANSGSSTALPASPGETVTPALGDVIACTITNTRTAANALLTIEKTITPVSDPINGTSNPKLIPGAIVTYTFAVSNTGSRLVDQDTVWLIDSLPSTLLVGTASSPTFTQGTPSSNLTFTAATDIAYSNAGSPPATFAGCTYTPTSSYDSNVHYVCLNPKGKMAASTGTPTNFTLSIRAQVK